MQAPGNFPRDYLQLDSNQLQQVQESIDTYKSQGLSNDPRCKALEQILHSHLAEQKQKPAVDIVSVPNQQQQFRFPQSQPLHPSYGVQQSPFQQQQQHQSQQSRQHVLQGPQQPLQSHQSMHQSQSQVQNHPQSQQSQQQQLRRPGHESALQKAAIAGMSNEKNNRLKLSGQQKGQEDSLKDSQRLNLFLQNNPDYGFHRQASGASAGRSTSLQFPQSSHMAGQMYPGPGMMKSSPQIKQDSDSQSLPSMRISNGPFTGYSSHGGVATSSTMASQMPSAYPFVTFPRNQFQSPAPGPSLVQQTGSMQESKPSRVQKAASISLPVSTAPSAAMASAAKQQKELQVRAEAAAAAGGGGYTSDMWQAQSLGFGQNSVPPGRGQTSVLKPGSNLSPIQNPPGTGFTKQQLACLRAQIMAIKRLKKGETNLSADLLEAIAPPPLGAGYISPQPAAGPVMAVRGQSSGSAMDSILNSGVSAAASRPAAPRLQSLKSPDNSPGMMSGALKQNPAMLKAAKSEVQLRMEKEEMKKRRRQEIRNAKKLASKMESGLQALPYQQQGLKVEERPTVSVGSEIMAMKLTSAVQQGDSMGAAMADVADKYAVSLSVRFSGPLCRAESDKKKMESSAAPPWEKVGYNIRDIMEEEWKNIFEAKRSGRLLEIEKVLTEGTQGSSQSTAVEPLGPDMRVKLKVEQKMLKLVDLQAKLRGEVELEQVAIAGMGDRPYRTFIRQCEKQRADMQKQTMLAQKAIRDKFLKTVVQGRKKMMEQQWAAKDARTARNRGVLKLHEKMLRDSAKRKDEDRNRRMEALKNNDVDAYRAMLEKQQTDMMPGDARAERFEVLSTFLSRTEEYLKKLGGKISAVKNQQELEDVARAAMAEARAMGFSEDEVVKAGERAMERSQKDMWETDPDSSAGNSVTRCLPQGSGMIRGSPF